MCVLCAGFVNRFLSMRVWVPLSNISFACYLVHPLLILLYNSKQETLIHYTDLNFVSVHDAISANQESITQIINQNKGFNTAQKIHTDSTREFYACSF